MKSFIHKNLLALVITQPFSLLKHKEAKQKPTKCSSTQTQKCPRRAECVTHNHKWCHKCNKEHPEPMRYSCKAHTRIIAGICDVDEGEGACTELVGEEVENDHDGQKL